MLMEMMIMNIFMIMQAHELAEGQDICYLLHACRAFPEISISFILCNFLFSISQNNLVTFYALLSIS